MPRLFENHPELVRLANNRVKVCRDLGAQARTQNDFVFAHRLDAHAAKFLRVVKEHHKK